MHGKRWFFAAVAIAAAVLAPAQQEELSETAPGRFGQAFVQDRHGFFLADTPTLPAFQEPPLTVELWAKVLRSDTFNLLIANEPKESARHWELYAYRGEGDFSVFIPAAEPSSIRSGVSITDGQWHFLAFVFESDRVRLYVDGELAADQAIKLEDTSDQLGNGGPLTFGRVVARRGKIPFLNGMLDDVRVSSVARGDLSVPDGPMQADAHTVALWDFDTRSSDGGFADASGHDRHILVTSKPRRSLNEIDLLSYDPRPGPMAAAGDTIRLRKGASDSRRTDGVLDLSGTWELAGDGEPVKRLRQPWADGVEAAVPGSVHGALWKAGRIADPYFGLQEAEARRQSFRTWWYKTTFPKPEGVEKARLVFDGVAVHCRVWLNNQDLGENEGMFGGPVFDVTGMLEEENTLVVRIDPAPLRGPAENDIDKVNYGWNNTAVFNNVYGWHYCNIPSLGIWRPVRLEAIPPVAMKDPFIVTRDASEGQMDLSVPLHGPAQGWSGTISGTFSPENFEGRSWHFEREVHSASAMKNVRLSFTIPEARLWWPNNLGDPHLYRMKLQFHPDGAEVGDGYESLFGIRTVEQAPLPGGPYPNKYNWQFVINGEPVFVKGTGWCTMDPLMDFSYERYERFVKLAQSQNVQMFRAWGSGMPETDEFYEACNRHGIMVMQEWPTAWNSHERQPLDVLERTVRLNTLRIRNHPSLVLYGGGNESSNPYGAAIDMMGRYAAELDGTRAFHRGEPYGGSIHNYDCYWGRRPLDRNLHLTADFIGEFGLASMPVLESVLRYTPEDEQGVWPPPDDGAIAHHTPTFNRNEDMERLIQYSGYFMPQDSLENFIIGSQLSQATGVRHTLELARTRYPECTGVLYYKMNDNYPAASWATADWYGATKIGHYVFQDAFAPLQASVIFDTLNPEGKEVVQPVFLLDDVNALKDRNWEVRVRAYNNNLDKMRESSFEGRGGIDKVRELGTFHLSGEQTQAGPILTVVDVLVDGDRRHRTFYWSNYESIPGSLMTLPRTSVKLAVEDGKAVFTNTGALPAVAVHVERPGHADTFVAGDNYVWLDPGETLRVAVSSTEGLSLRGWNLED